MANGALTNTAGETGSNPTMTASTGHPYQRSDTELTAGTTTPAPIAARRHANIAATNNGIDVLDGSGRASRLFTFEGTMHEPRPLIKRPRERIIPSHIDPSKATGTLVLDNVYVGDGILEVVSDKESGDADQ